MTEQFINKSTLKDNYSVIPNNMLNDEGLDADCLAVMVYLLSKPSNCCLLYTSPSPRDGLLSRMPSSA